MSDLNPSTDREIDVFNRAKVQPPGEERWRFVESACDGDASLCARVDELLRAHDEAGSFLEPNPAASPDVEAECARLKPEEPGDTIGHYKLLQRIGEGGFGTVWMAEQSVPVKRRVALKIIKLGMDTKEVVARFEQERQALALMDHPNIARVFDAGATPVGRPYFVMELVRGIKITEYCDEQELSTDERVELFIHVCQAVQHAHQKGIIHRDLKPSNILVTINDGEPVPKVIDFGVAKATQGHLSEATLFTKFEQMIGTPLYMSPEQAEMTSLDIDTRSDIYSLGVLLYELLTGKTPLDTSTMARAGMDEIRRLIREVAPPKPSARLKTLDGNELTTTAKRRHTDAGKLPGALRGDIDWIVMKCLEKDRKRRYETANGLAADLQRHLRNEVVIARPPTAAYLISKLIKRNKLAFLAATGIAVSILVGMAATAWQLVQTRKAEHRAVAALDELRATAPAFAEQARALAAKERYEEAIEKLNYAFQLRPDVADYLVAKADLLQAQAKRNQLSEAATVYREALRLAPGHARAEASAKLCDELLAAKSAEDGELTRESLAKLHLAIQQQQRPVAELIPVARMLGEEKKLLLEHWTARLRDLPVSTERPLDKRLTMREDGRLALDLSGTKVVDLAPLAGAPLAALNLSGCAELKVIAPLRELKLDRLELSGTGVSDLTPLRDMKSLETLYIPGSQVTDLSPLSGLRLKSVNFSQCAVTDLTPIRHMPLEEMNLGFTRVADLSPLVGMPVKMIDLTRTPVLDFTPLAKLPLEKCYLQHSRIPDLAVFRGKPLKELALWGCVDARNFAVLSEIKSLELLLLPSQYRSLPAEEYAAIGALRNHPRLRQIGSEIMNQMGYAATGSKEVFWRDWDREQSFVPGLRASGVTFFVMKLPNETYSVGVESGQPLRDLSVFKGAPISELRLPQCRSTDLSPLQGLPLRVLDIAGSPVVDLSPLRGMPLEDFYLYDTKVKDLSPLLGMPLKRLFLERCKSITDVSVLKDLRELDQLTIPCDVPDLTPLRGLSKLRRLAYNRSGVAPYDPITTADQFWKEYDANPWIARLAKSELKPEPLVRQEDGTWVVNFNKVPITNLDILRGAPISSLYIGNTQVSSLEPLRGMPLKLLQIFNTKVTNLEPIAAAALNDLQISGTKVADISVVRGMPLTRLQLHGCTELTDLSPLREVKTLTTLTLPPNAKAFEFLRAFPNLTRLSFKYGKDFEAAETTEEFWKSYDSQNWLYALRASGVKIDEPKREADGTWNVKCADPKFTDLSALRGAPISGLSLTNSSVADLSGLQSLPLRNLSIGWTKVTDLRPLSALSLETLDARANAISDLSPLRSSPLGRSLKRLQIYRTNVTDFSPLAECVNLEYLDASSTSLESLEALRGKKLTGLLLMNTKVKDIAVLAGMPLEDLQLNGTPVTDVRPLLSCPTLKRLTLPAGARNVEGLKKLPALEELSYESLPGGAPSQKAVEFWAQYEQQPWQRRLQESASPPKEIKRLADGAYSVDLKDTPVADLEPIRGAPIASLGLGNTAVSNLGPLRGMPLRQLWIYDTRITDLGPLSGAKLEFLNMARTAVKDISVLRGMPLTILKLQDCQQLSDLSPLAGTKALKSLTLPPNARDFEFLRALPNLELLSFKETSLPPHKPDKTAAQFWKEYDERAWLRRLEKEGIKPVAVTRLGAGGWDASFHGVRMVSLEPLKGAPIARLNVGNTGISDLAPLRGMPLERLWFYGTNVSDLSRLKGMQLKSFHAAGAPISDISVLRGMPLTEVKLHGCRMLTDLSPLAESRELIHLTIPTSAKNFEFLRALPKLERLSYWETTSKGGPPSKTVEEFWKEFDAKSGSAQTLPPRRE